MASRIIGPGRATPVKNRLPRSAALPSAAALPQHPTARAQAPVPQVQRLVVDEGSAGQRLDNVLLRLLKGVPKTHVYRVIRSGEVRVNMKRAAADTRVQLGDELRLPPVRTAQRAVEASSVPAREFTVLLEDEHLIAIDKPSGVAVHGGSGVSFGVIEQLRRARPEARFLELVHRLDKETSGVMLVAKKRAALTALQDQFRQRGTDKRYAALVHGVWPESRKVIDVPLHKTLDAQGERIVRAGHDHDDAKRSITLVAVAQRFAQHTLLDVTLKTGRTHQIRVHLSHEGCPIVGDPKYGNFEHNRALARGTQPGVDRFARMFLHARQLAFDHPADGRRVVVTSPLPTECVALLEQLRTPRAPSA